MKEKYAKFVHEFIDTRGVRRWAVAEWIESAGEYQRPMDKGEQALTGCHTYFARTAEGMGGYKTREQALRRARYLYEESLDLEAMFEEAGEA